MEKCIIFSFRRDPDEIADYLIDSGFTRFKGDIVISDDVINCGKTLMRAEKEVSVGYLTQVYMNRGRGGELYRPPQAGRVLVSRPYTGLFLDDTCVENQGSFYFDGLVDMGTGNRPFPTGHIVIPSQGALEHLSGIYEKLDRIIISACRGCVSDISDAVNYLKMPQEKV